MCGRFTLSQSTKAIAKFFRLADVPNLEARYNIAPTQMVPGVLCGPKMSAQSPEESVPRLQLLRWGLVPSWAKDLTMGARLINARAETVAEKPSFRSAFRRRRCLIVADGFYEWQRQERKKQPFYFRLLDGQLFAFAGLWERWENPEGETVVSCTILTTEANELMCPIHDRMPVILDPKDYDLWLDPAVQEAERLQQMLCPYRSEAMTAYPVSTQVNKPTNNSRECINSL